MSREIEAAEVVVGNEDLKREILLRLPAKSVTRFKLVCKQWNSLISDHQFVKSLHLRRNPSKLPTGWTCEIDVYSSESQSWRFISYGFQIPKEVNTVVGHFFNGAIHWIGKKDSICFDVYSEEMLQFKTGPGKGISYIGEDGTHFHLATGLTRSFFGEDGAIPDEDFCILELNRDFSNWVNKYKVSASAFPELTASVFAFGHKISPFTPLCVVKGVREEDAQLVLKIPGKIVSYNFLKREVKTLCGLPSTLPYDSFKAYPYMETLYSV